MSIFGRWPPARRPHLDHGGNVKLLHQVFEVDGRLRAHGGVLRPHQVFEPLRRGIIGAFCSRLSSAVGGAGISPSAAALPRERAGAGFDSLTTNLGPPPEAGGADGPLRRRRMLLAFLLFFRLDLRRSMTSNFGVSLMISCLPIRLDD